MSVGISTIKSTFKWQTVYWIEDIKKATTSNTVFWRE